MAHSPNLKVCTRHIQQCQLPVSPSAEPKTVVINVDFLIRSKDVILGALGWYTEWIGQTGGFSIDKVINKILNKISSLKKFLIM